MHGSASLRSLPPGVLLDIEVTRSQVPLSIFYLGGNTQLLACHVYLRESFNFAG